MPEGGDDRDARQRFAAYDQAPIGIAEVDLDGRYLRVNAKFLAVRGEDRDVVIGSSCFVDGSHPDELPAELALWEELKAGAIPQYAIEKRFRRGDGEWHWSQVTCSIIRDGDGQPLYAVRIIDDIDARQTALERLRDSEFRLSLAKSAAGFGLFDWDVPGRKVSWSREACELFGLPPDDQPDYAAWRNALHPEDRRRIVAQVKAALDAGAAFDGEFRIVRPDGQVRWLAGQSRPILDPVDGRVVRVIAVSTDVTERHQLTEELERRVGDRTAALEQAVAQLRASEARYSALFENSPNDLFVLDVRSDGGFVFEKLNPNLERSTGYSPEALVGKTPRQALSPGNVDFIEARYRECVATRRRVEYEVRAQVPLGEVIRHTILVPLVDERGIVRKLFGTTTDLTRTRRIEEELLQAQKMDAIGQLTGGVAHDFNNLLTAVLGNLELARGAAGAEPSSLRRLLDAAVRGAERGATLTRQLLAFARKQHLDNQPTDLNAVVTGMLDMLRRTLGPEMRVEAALAPELWPALLDANQVEVAILNLAVNARDAMPNGGSLVIATANLPAREAARRPDLPHGDYVTVSVTDDGTGMSEEVKARAFEPFFTTKDVGKGSGLGLSQVHGLAKQSGGTVFIDSRAGRGTTVTICLPRLAAAPAAVAAEQAVAMPVVPAPMTGAEILVVDDDELVREVVADSLAAAGYRIRKAADSRGALAALESEAADLAIVDYAMPGMTGLDLARVIRAKFADIPILLITGFADADHIAGGEGFAFLPKPFRGGELVARVQQLLAPGAPEAAAPSAVVRA